LACYFIRLDLKQINVLPDSNKLVKYSGKQIATNFFKSSGARAAARELMAQNPAKNYLSDCIRVYQFVMLP
jgi:hypothetical protein